tara:strand:+ start:504 stop:743 length:240 start_codon:yes stop_codon:yes gene_type:complete
MRTDEQKIYDRHGESLVDLVESMKAEGLADELAVSLILDMGIDLAFCVSPNEAIAREAIEYMTEEKAKLYHKKNRKEAE